jgi:hypothetical protein
MHAEPSSPLRTFFIIAAAHILHHCRCAHSSSSPLHTFFIIAAAHILHSSLVAAAWYLRRSMHYFKLF